MYVQVVWGKAFPLSAPSAPTAESVTQDPLESREEGGGRLRKLGNVLAVITAIVAGLFVLGLYSLFSWRCGGGARAPHSALHYRHADPGLAALALALSLGWKISRRRRQGFGQHDRNRLVRHASYQRFAHVLHVAEPDRQRSITGDDDGRGEER